MPSMKGLAPGATSGRVPSLNKGGGKNKEGNTNARGIKSSNPTAGQQSSGWIPRQGNQMQQGKSTVQGITDSEEEMEGGDKFSTGGTPANAEEAPIGGQHGPGVKAFPTSGLKRTRQGQITGKGQASAGPGAEPTGEGPYDEMIAANAKAFATDIRNRNKKIKANSTVSPRGQKD